MPGPLYPNLNFTYTCLVQGMPASLGGGGVPARAGALSFLRENAQFQSLRVLVQANPQILEPMLQELGKQNPRLLEQINANQVRLTVYWRPFC